MSITAPPVYEDILERALNVTDIMDRLTTNLEPENILGSGKNLDDGLMKLRQLN